jgi:hypothetical protein
MLCLAANLRWQIIKSAAKQAEVLQRGQQGFERGKLAKAVAVIQAERFE